MPIDRLTLWLERALLGWAAMSLGVALYDVTVDGFFFRIYGLRFSSSDASTPFRNGMIAALVGVWLHERRAGDKAWWVRMPQWSRGLALATVTASVALAVQFGIFVAGGSDGYGYVSQASLWASGRLVVPEPLADIERALGVSTAPLGYRPALVPGSNVPTYAPGLPMTMALMSMVGGDRSVYYVLPLFAAVSIWMTFLLGRRISGPRTGLVAALLLTVSPIFLFQSLAPMSDVPVTAWFLVAWVLALRGGRGAAAGAGLAVSAAILTRPNLAPLALVLLIAIVLEPPRWRRACLFCAAVVPGILAVALINRYLYGSVSSSGYGSLRDLYEWANAAKNLRSYPTWLIEQHSPAIVIAFAAPFFIRREEADRGDDGRRVALLMMLFCALLFLSYVFYGAFDEWPYLRFLLPGIPLLLVMASSVFVTILGRLPVAFRIGPLFAGCVFLVLFCVGEARRLGVFAIAFSEQRYEAVGRYVRDALPANAVVLTMIESGSIRHYSGRPTLRWDTVPKDALDRSIDLLRARGYAPYLLLEDWEEPLYRARFEGKSELAQVDWPAAAECQGPITVRLYSLDDRARHRAGQVVARQAIPRS